MSESETAAVVHGDQGEDDCPLCLEPLPPYWDMERITCFICCGKRACTDCNNKRGALLERALAEGSFGKAEEQLAGSCPFCRAKAPDPGYDENGRRNMTIVADLMRAKFDKGQLPLTLYAQLGSCYVKGYYDAEIDFEKGTEIQTLGAEKGDPICQFNIGHAYRDGGEGLEISLPEAKRWFLAAAEQGHAVAEYQLALLLKDEGNDADYLRYLKGSASKGYDPACCDMGRVHYLGYHNVQRSTEQAICALTPAAERGHTLSMGRLGYAMCCPHDGTLDPPTSNPNFTKGMHWLRRAAEKGDEEAIAVSEELEQRVSTLKCFMCNKRAPPEKALLRCSRCRAAWYCSRGCQRRHWKAKEGGHKQFCIKWE